MGAQELLLIVILIPHILIIVAIIVVINSIQVQVDGIATIVSHHNCHHHLMVLMVFNLVGLI